MSEKKDWEELKEVLTVVSDKVPVLIKGIIESVLSESVGKDLGKAVAAFYAELTKSGLPEEVAIEMTKDYLKTFTNFSQILKEMKFKAKE